MSERFSSIVTFAAILVATTSCQRGPATVQHELREARRLATDARLQFGKAVDASNQAVMAGTDEQSIAFAREAEQKAGVVEHEVADLASLTQRLQFPAEIQSMVSLKEELAAYRSVDKELLALAVENSNLKAQRLSFGPAREAADRFKAVLLASTSAAPSKDRCRIDALVQSAVLNVRELQVLQGPHIAAAEDAAMASLESEMVGLETKTAADLTELGALVTPGALASAQAELEKLKSIRAQIVGLSRKNSNLRSLDLALRVKPPLSTACDNTLRQVQDQLADEGSKATR